MKERPILFTGAMVRALLDGDKTQTRRIVKPQLIRIGDSSILQWKGGLYEPERLKNNSNLMNHGPYGQPGDQLWVRETWTPVDSGAYDDGQSHECAIYRADTTIPIEYQPRWKPSIHMPRWASRILLEITAVRVERLQDISEADAKAEGAPDFEEGIDAPAPDEEYEWARKASFQRLWESINGLGNWTANPWVWVVEFRRIEGA